MTTKENVLNTFHELGFLLEHVEGFGYKFTYEGSNFLYLPDKEDEEFLSIALPGIYDLQDDNLATFISLTEKLNSTPKYVKAYKLGDSLWLFYERELLGGEDLKLVISRMILHLDAALCLGRQFLATAEEKAETETGVEAEGEDYLEATKEIADLTEVEETE